MRRKVFSGLWIALLGGGLFGCLPLAQAQQSIPPNASPGAILMHDVRNSQLQQREPWLVRPVQPDDVQPLPSDDLIIDQRGYRLEGQVLPTLPPPPAP